MKTRLTPEEMQRFHDGMCGESLHDGPCSCLVAWVEALQKEADAAVLQVEAARKERDETEAARKEILVKLYDTKRLNGELRMALEGLMEVIAPREAWHVEGQTPIGIAFTKAYKTLTERPKDDWAICGWCAGEGRTGINLDKCPKCGGGGGKYIEKRNDERPPMPVCDKCGGGYGVTHSLFNKDPQYKRLCHKCDR